MSELQIIQSTLEIAARRRRWGRALRGLWWGVLVGGILSLLLIGGYHVLPLPLWILILAATVPLPAMLVGLVIGGWRKPPLIEVARWVDNRERLKERLSTALEVCAEPDGTTWRNLVLSDAAQHAQDLNPRRLLPFHLPKVARWAAVVLAMGAGLGFVPEYRSKSFLQKKQDQQNIKEAGRLLAELTKRTLDKRPPAFEPTQKAMEAVSSLGDQLAKQTLTRSDALKELANTADKLKDELKEFGKDPALKRLEQAARSGGTGDSQSASGLQKQIESLQKQVGSPTGNPDALDKLQKDLARLQQAARGLADKNSPGSEAERQKMSESLAALSKQVQDMGLQLPQLDNAIDALAEIGRAHV